MNCVTPIKSKIGNLKSKIAMCGITGIYALNNQPIQPAEITAQIETIVHRGPNEGAVYLSAGQFCGLGIRRLSIIDVAGGQQPLSNEDRTLHLVYNGETYNHQTLRTELERLGHRPKTHSDGEVIVYGYKAWGPETVLQKMQGMFAFALWDERRQQLFLARDRFGIKPLYYAEYAGRLYFASEIKAILAQPDFPHRVNLPALEAMLRLGFVPGPETMFESIYKLPPAHFLLAKNGCFSLKGYWQLDYQENKAITESEAAEQFLALLQEVVQSHLMSEVPLGALLSGGLDSGTLVALVQSSLHRFWAVNGHHRTTDLPTGMNGLFPAVDSTNQKLRTVSIGFEQATYDESALALGLAQFIGTEHHAVVCTSHDFDDYPEIMTHLEEPQCSATAVPIYKLYQACRQAGLTVVLTGEGSDELLGGYHWHRGDALMRPLLRLPSRLRQAVAASPLPMSAAARRVLARGAKDIPSRYQDWLEIEGGDYRQNLLSPEVRQPYHNGLNPLLTSWTEKLLMLQTATPLHQTLWLESQTRMVDFINFEVDKMSMAHSVEARVPFLDHQLWEFCAGLPDRYKLKGSVEKSLLRQATKNILPEATRLRRKKGLAAPYAHWLRSERLPDWAETALSEQAIRRAGLFQPQVVQTLRQAHQNSRVAGHLGALLMGVLSTQVWVSQFIR
jgi:asparagine synthase (glutamine-hydrolysing)